jgi:hypothetical protein
MKDDNRMGGHAPRRGVPLRDWSCASYDKNTGKAAASSMPPQASYSFDGVKVTPSAQLPESHTVHTVKHGKTHRG